MTDTTNSPATPGANPDLARYLPGSEGSKFQTVEDLAKSKLESDRFIEALKAEQAELRNTLKELEGNLSKASGIDEVLRAMQSLSGGNAGSREDGRTPDRSGNFGDGNQSDSARSGIEETRVMEMVQKLLSERERGVVENQNWNEVQSKFTARYPDPDQARLAMKATAQELGMTLDTFTAISKTNPNLVLRAAGLAPQGNGTPDPLRFTAGNQAGTNVPAGGPVKNESYYNKLRQDLRAKGKLSEFYSARVQQEIMKSAEILGDDFFK